jgi:hypothetical protein
MRPSTIFAKCSTPCWRRYAIRSRGTKNEEGKAAYLFGVSFSSVKRVALVWSPSQAKLWSRFKGPAVEGEVWTVLPQPLARLR